MFCCRALTCQDGACSGALECSFGSRHHFEGRLSPGRCWCRLTRLGSCLCTGHGSLSIRHRHFHLFISFRQNSRHLPAGGSS